VITDTALTATFLALVSLAVLTITAWLAHAAWSTIRERRTARRRPAALQALATAAGDGNTRPALTALAALDADARVGAVVDMAYTLAGQQRRRLNELVRETRIWTNALAWARSGLWSRRLRASRLITLFGNGTEAEGERLLADSRPETRAQTAEWAGEYPTPARIQMLLDLLGDPDPRCRFAAREALVRAGGAAVDAVGARLGTGGTAISTDLLAVATAMAVPRFLDDAIRLSTHPEPEIRAGATRLLGAIGGPRAAATLEGLLRDPSPEVRVAAVEGLGSLGHWQAAGAVGALLDDEAWRVRHAAALALGRMGPTGTLLLQRASRGEGPAADTASYALGLPPALMVEA
jgi:HEAT repeat protein